MRKDNYITEMGYNELKEINLWNVNVDFNKKKTKNVVNYIKSLPIFNNFSNAQEQYFEKLRSRALLKDSADSMLRYIGYQVGRLPKIYNKSRVD